jgi:hypothetical protein
MSKTPEFGKKTQVILGVNAKSILHLSMAGGLCLTRQFHSGTGHCMCGAYVLNGTGPTSLYTTYYCI